MLKAEPLNMNSKRSINLIVEALLDLMKEKPFKSISIKELTTRAGVVRNTFYAHFDSKEDILSYHIYQIFDSKYNEYQVDGPLEDGDFVPLYFEVWGEHLDLLKLLHENDLLLTLNHLDSQFEVFCVTYFTNSQCELSATANKYANPLYSDGLASILKTWIRTGMKETPKELAGVFDELMSVNLTNYL